MLKNKKTSHRAVDESYAKDKRQQSMYTPSSERTQLVCASLFKMNSLQRREAKDSHHGATGAESHDCKRFINTVLTGTVVTVIGLSCGQGT